MKKRIFSVVLAIFLLLSLLFVTASCGDDGAGDGVRPPSSSGAENGDASQKVITTVSVTAQSETFKESMDRLRTELAAAGGYIATSEVSYREDSRSSATLTMKVPADKGDAFVEGMKEYMAVSDISRTTENVTGQYLDLASRISALEAEQESLEALIKAAGNYNDITIASERLYQVIAELEAKKELLKDYEGRIAYQTVRLSLRETEKADSDGDDGVFARIGNKFVASLKAVGNFFTSLFVFFIGNLPMLLLLAAIFVLVALLIGRLNRRSREKMEKLQEEYARKRQEYARQQAEYARQQAEYAQKQQEMQTDVHGDDLGSDATPPDGDA